MAKIYLRQITDGKMSLENMPERWQNAVALLMAALEGEGASADE